MIKIDKLTNADIGRWVVFQPKRENEEGRIKSWNDHLIYVVYKCNNEWHRYQDFTGTGTLPSDLSFIGREPKERQDEV